MNRFAELAIDSTLTVYTVRSMTDDTLLYNRKNIIQTPILECIYIQYSYSSPMYIGKL